MRDGIYFIRYKADDPSTERKIHVSGNMVKFENSRFYVEMKDVLYEDTSWIKAGEDVRLTDPSYALALAIARAKGNNYEQ